LFDMLSVYRTRFCSLFHHNSWANRLSVRLDYTTHIFFY